MDLSGGQVVISALIGGVATVLGSILAYSAGKGTSIAAIQNSLNASFEKLVQELQEERKRDRQRLLDLEAQCNGLSQHIESLEGILRRHGIEIPRRPLVQPVFMLVNQDDQQVAN